MTKEEIMSTVSREEYEALVAEITALKAMSAGRTAGDGRCAGKVERDTKAGKKVMVRCIVPLSDGQHVDGNPSHYNGSSHYVKDTFTRG